MIINVKKYVIYGLRNDCESFFKEAQLAGFIEFIQPKEKLKKVSSDVQDIMSAIKVLKKQMPQPQEMAPIEGKRQAEKILQLQEELYKYYEQKRYYETEIIRIGPFGDFQKKDIEYIESSSKRKIQFFTKKAKKKEDKSLPDELIYLNAAYDLEYYIAINRESVSYPKMSEVQIIEPLHVLKEKLYKVQEKIQGLENALKKSAKYLDCLQNSLVQALNTHNLSSAKDSISYPIEEKVFALEAWIPVNKLKAFRKLIENLHIEFIEVAKDLTDRKPTYMENKNFARIGEDLVHIYDTPSPGDKDPSGWVVTFFAIFFAMITADAGYGIIFLILGLFMRWKFPTIQGMGKRLIRLVLLLSSTCIIWGILTASFFGLELSTDNPLRKFSILHLLAEKKASYHREVKDDVYKYWVDKTPLVENVQSSTEFLLKSQTIRDGKVIYEARDEFYDNILMECSILIGVIHLALSFMRYLGRNYSNAGWILFMIGGYLYFPSQLNATSLVHFLSILEKPYAFLLGQYCMYAGIGIAVIAALIQRGIAASLSEIMNLIQVFADVLSYLRLYALGLAGMIMASTFNDIGMAMGLKFGFIVIIIGHLVNITLVIMGGVIHGLRLNFLEWYHYSFEGGGREFRPLKFLK